MKKLKELWEIDKKMVILYGLGGIFVLLFIIILTLVLYNIFKKYDYHEIEKFMVQGSESYLKANKGFIPTEDNPETIIDTSTLISNKYMKDFKKLTKDNCHGEIKVIWKNNEIRYIPTLLCDQYETKNLYQKILDFETIQTEGNGLHLLNENYTYRGEFVNNYISFAGFKFRIVKMNEEEMYLILADTINTLGASFVYDDRYNETIESNRGKNDFQNSRVYLSLKDIYEKDFVKYHKYILNHEACIHTRNEKDKDTTGAVECFTTFNTPISLLAVYDYMNASLDPNCDTAISRNCSNYNYLAKTKNKYWLLNGTNENTFEVYVSDPTGKINLENASVKRDLRPLFVIPSNLLYKSGIGTIDSPYTFYEY